MLYNLYRLTQMDHHSDWQMNVIWLKDATPNYIFVFLLGCLIMSCTKLYFTVLNCHIDVIEWSYASQQILR